VALPDFLIIGAPKAGTTALHAALGTHPQLFLSPVKEPKHFLCDGRPPRPQPGPGDAHSAQEWIWRSEDYEALFDAAPPSALRGESTPFYLYDRAAQVRLARAVPEARLIVVVRDPVDRAYSNWTHLWSDGLEPIGDFLSACAAEDERVDAGWAPIWHYLRLGRYGEQLADLFDVFAREQVHVLRYRDVVESPQASLDTICRFLGVEPGLAHTVPAENVHPFVRPSPRTSALSAAIRAGAAAGAHAPPQLWRAASVPLTWALQRGGGRRPPLPVEARRQLVGGFADDVHLLSALTGEDFGDWLGDEGRGEFSARAVGAAR
jgi:hypothetical protein